MEAEDFEGDPEMDMQEYTKGFNWAYTIAQHDEKLALELQSSIKHDAGDRWSGLKHGFNQFFYEKKQEQAKTTDRGYEETGGCEKDEKSSRMDELDDLRGDSEDRDVEREP